MQKTLETAHYGGLVELDRRSAIAAMAAIVLFTGPARTQDAPRQPSGKPWNSAPRSAS